MENKTKYFIATLDYMALALIFKIEIDKISPDKRPNSYHNYPGSSIYKIFQKIGLYTGDMYYDQNFTSNVQFPTYTLGVTPESLVKLNLQDVFKIVEALEFQAEINSINPRDDIDYTDPELKEFIYGGETFYTYENLEFPTVTSSQVKLTL